MESGSRHFHQPRQKLRYRPMRDETQDVLGRSSCSALELLPLAWVRASEITLPVPRSEWAEAILPALGMDAIRLVGIRLPRRGGPLGDDLVAWFDQARHKFDAGDYRGAIERARDVRNAVEKRLQATRSNPVGAKVRAARELPEGAATTAFLDGVWLYSIFLAAAPPVSAARATFRSAATKPCIRPQPGPEAVRRSRTAAEG